jgi:hypothetical protein
LLRYSVLRNNFEGKIEGMIGMKEKRGRRRKQIRDGFKKTRGYWKLKEEALHCTLCRTRLGRDYGPLAIKSAE